jgi:hypothetical protein
MRPAGQPSRNLVDAMPSLETAMRAVVEVQGRQQRKTPRTLNIRDDHFVGPAAFSFGALTGSGASAYR